MYENMSLCSSVTIVPRLMGWTTGVRFSEGARKGLFLFAATPPPDRHRPTQIPI